MIVFVGHICSSDDLQVCFSAALLAVVALVCQDSEVTDAGAYNTMPSLSSATQPLRTTPRGAITLQVVSVQYPPCEPLLSRAGA